MSKRKNLSLISLSACYHLVAQRLLDLEAAHRDERLDESDLSFLLQAFRFYNSILDELESSINFQKRI